MNKVFLFLMGCSLATGLYGQSFSGGFSFYLPEFDSTTQHYLPEFPAFTIMETDRVSAQGDAFMAKGKPIRFWGVNIVAAACFPPKSKAAGIAARMRKMGINLVRFHHLDNPWSGDDGSIFNNSTGTRQLNTATLDRLDFFIFQLKKNGIYVNMNLNVSRTFVASDGVVGADSLPEFGKGVTFFDPWLQFLQREYAQQLMTHVNPYTGMSLAQDPVLAMMEMNNENSLYGFWKDDELRPFAVGGGLMVRHSNLLDSLWNVFLAEKYASQQALADAWNIGVSAAGAGEVLQNRGFENGATLAPWSLELHETAAATFSAAGGNVHSGNYAGLLQVNNVTGTEWHIQLKQAGFSLKKDSTYQLRFWARAASNVQFSVSVMRDDAPYTWYAGKQFFASPNWQLLTLTFIAPEDNIGFGRISISPMNNVGEFRFDDFSLGKPEISGLEPGESLGAAARILWTDRLSYTDKRVADMAEFYIGLQKKHFDELRTYLKTNLGIPAPITGTNALVGPADAAEHADLDFLDDHSYWDHPWFPNNAWDPYDWLIGNQPMVKDPGFSAMTTAFSGINFLDKPYTISEYNHAAPNRFRTEMPAALAAYASFHGADGLMFFDYNGDDQWESDVSDGYFSLNRDNSIMALFPSCARAYRAGLIAPDPAPIVVQYTAKDLYGMPKSDFDGRWSKFTTYPKRLNLTHAVKTAGYQAASTTDFSTLPAPENNSFLTTTGETALDTDKGLIKTATPQFCAVSGFLQDVVEVSAGDLTLVQADGFGSVTWVSIGDTPLKSAQRSLLTISAIQQNTNMLWDGAQSVHNNWGTAPTLQKPLLVRLRLAIQADYIVVHTLNNLGKEISSQTIQATAPGQFEILINQAQSKSLWFGIQAFGGEITGTQAPEQIADMRVSPNPAPISGKISIRWEMLQAGRVQLNLFNAEGKQVRKLLSETLTAGMQTQEFDLSGLPAGSYYLNIDDRTGNGGLGARRKSVGILIKE